MTNDGIIFTREKRERKIEREFWMKDDQLFSREKKRERERERIFG